MALVEQSAISKIEILEDETIQVRRSRRIIDDVTGEIIAERYHRQVYNPLTPLTEIQGARIRKIAELIWTPKVIEDYRLKVQNARPTTP